MQPYRCGLDVELQRLPSRQAAGELTERVADLLALGRGHHERVLRRGAQVAHEPTLAGHDQPLTVERLDRAQITRGPRLVASHPSHSNSPAPWGAVCAAA